VSEYITLLGAEQVQSAAGTMREAALQMQRAASEISGALERHERFMGQLLLDMQAMLSEAGKL
jgi:hypothetical protein